MQTLLRRSSWTWYCLHLHCDGASKARTWGVEYSKLCCMFTCFRCWGKTVNMLNTIAVELLNWRIPHFWDSPTVCLSAERPKDNSLYCPLFSDSFPSCLLWKEIPSWCVHCISWEMLWILWSACETRKPATSFCFDHQYAMGSLMMRNWDLELSTLNSIECHSGISIQLEMSQ